MRTVLSYCRSFDALAAARLILATALPLFFVAGIMPTLSHAQETLPQTNVQEEEWSIPSINPENNAQPDDAQDAPARPTEVEMTRDENPTPADTRDSFAARRPTETPISNIPPPQNGATTPNIPPPLPMREVPSPSTRDAPPPRPVRETPPALAPAREAPPPTPVREAPPPTARDVAPSPSTRNVPARAAEAESASTESANAESAPSIDPRDAPAQKLFSEAVALEQESLEKAAVKYEEVVQRFEKAATPGSRLFAARALLNKGNILNKQDNPKEAISTYERIERTFGSERTPAMREVLAASYVSRAETLYKQGDLEKTLDTYAQLEQQFSNEESAFVKRLVDITKWRVAEIRVSNKLATSPRPRAEPKP